MRNKKRNTRLVLLVMLICITFGYAALRSKLNINGSTRVVNSTWDVHFANYQKSNTTNITPTVEPIISGTSTTTITYEINLTSPGDVYEFTVDGVNSGSMDAMIESISSKLDEEEITSENPLPNYLEYSVTYSDGTAIANNHLLKHGTRETYRVKVKYKENLRYEEYPQTVEDLSFSLTMNYVQADDNAFEPYILYSRFTSGYPYIGGTVPNNTYASRTAFVKSTKSNTVYYKVKLDSKPKWCLIRNNSNSCSKNPSIVYPSKEDCERSNSELYNSQGECRKQESNIIDQAFIQVDLSKKQYKNLRKEYIEAVCQELHPDNSPYRYEEWYAEEGYAADMASFNDCVSVFDNNIPRGLHEFQVGIDESNSATTPVYDDNKAKFIQLFGSNSCSDNGSFLDCSFYNGDWSFNGSLNKDGTMSIDLDSGEGCSAWNGSEGTMYYIQCQ